VAGVQVAQQMPPEHEHLLYAAEVMGHL